MMKAKPTVMETIVLLDNPVDWLDWFFMSIPVDSVAYLYSENKKFKILNCNLKNSDLSRLEELHNLRQACAEIK